MDRLYYSDSNLLEFAAEVTGIREARKEAGLPVWEIALDRSAFYPASGGQPFDMGTLTARSPRGSEVVLEIDGVREDPDGEVWHQARKPLLTGTRVEGRVDAARRRDHMQQHSGQHLLSACFLEIADWPTVSFHLGPELSTIDLRTGEAGSAEVSAVCERVSALANARIFDDLAVTIHSVTPEEARAMLADGRLRKLPERAGDFRVIEIAGVEHNACGGTHVRGTGQIGSILLRGMERVRDTWRVGFVCGGRAVRQARADFETMEAAGRVLSVGRGELAGAAAAILEQAKSAGKQAEKLLAERAALEGRALAAEAREGGIVEREFAGRPAAFLKIAAASASAASGHGCFLCWARGEGRVDVVLACGAASGRSAGEILRSTLAAHGGKGGGLAALAQGSVPEDGLAAFLHDVSAATREND